MCRYYYVRVTGRFVTLYFAEINKISIKYAGKCEKMRKNEQKCAKMRKKILKKRKKTQKSTTFDRVFAIYLRFCAREF